MRAFCLKVSIFYSPRFLPFLGGNGLSILVVGPLKLIFLKVMLLTKFLIDFG